MSPNIEVTNDGKKFMWDGQVYDSKDEAARARQSYEDESFLTWTLEEDGKFLVYTRRVVSQIVVPAQ